MESPGNNFNSEYLLPDAEHGYPNTNPFLDTDVDANMLKAGLDFMVTPDGEEFSQKAYDALKDIRTKCAADFTMRCSDFNDAIPFDYLDTLPFQLSEAKPTPLTRHLKASTVDKIKFVVSMYTNQKEQDKEVRLNFNSGYHKDMMKNLKHENLRRDVAARRQLSSDDNKYKLQDEHHHHDHDEEHHHHHDGHHEDEDHEDEDQDELDSSSSEIPIAPNGVNQNNESQEDSELIDPSIQNPQPVTSIVLPSIPDFLPFQIPGFQINLPGFQLTYPGAGQPLPPLPQPPMDPSFTFNDPPQGPPMAPMDPSSNYNGQPQGPPVNSMIPPPPNQPFFGFFPPNVFNNQPPPQQPVYTYPVDGPMNPVVPVNNGMNEIDGSNNLPPVQPFVPPNDIQVDPMPMIDIEPDVEPMPFNPNNNIPPTPPVTPHGHHPPVPPPMDDYYRFSLGYGLAGDMCMKQNYSKLSPACQDSMRFLYDTHRDYTVTSMDAKEDRDHDFHHFHHHFDMFWPIAFFTLIIALFIKKAYFHRHTKHRHQKINAVLQIIRENPTLKAVVEADTGFILPDSLPLGCPFHREGSTGYRIVKVIGIVILALASVAFSMCITATILLNMAIDPETGDINPPSPYIASLIFLGIMMVTGGVMYGTIKAVRYVLGTSSSSVSSPSAASGNSPDHSSSGGGNVIVVTSEGSPYNTTPANDLTTRIRQQVNEAYQALANRLHLNNAPTQSHAMYVPLRDQETAGEDIVRNPVNATAPPQMTYAHASPAAATEARSVNAAPVQGMVCMPVTVTTAHPVANINLF